MQQPHADEMLLQRLNDRRGYTRVMGCAPAGSTLGFFPNRPLQRLVVVDTITYADYVRSREA